MKKIITMATVLFAILFLLLPNVFAATTLEDGTYQINYSVIKADSNSASMSDGYFAKPAKLDVVDGEISVQINLTTSMIKELQVESKDVTEVSSNGEIRTVKFPVSSISNPILAEMHVIANESYDHWYTVRFSFDESTLEVIQLAESNTDEANSTETTESTGSNSTSSNNDQSSSTGEEEKVINESNKNNVSNEQVSNPETGEPMSITLLSLLLISSVVFLFSRKIKLNR
ncbi:NEAT domain-containing protein [Paraliobacillus sediminis]|uniref:NEAT domain-containing protein n=1 Tax=Paraliobacillus sediminis TaxID=1885916 RepID=UPI000E3DEADF|nr:NEAT domain-containing protein [Paraliobacillus sediminis]